MMIMNDNNTIQKQKIIEPSDRVLIFFLNNSYFRFESEYSSKYRFFLQEAFISAEVTFVADELQGGGGAR